jgi:hypothetical protein
MDICIKERKTTDSRVKYWMEGLITEGDGVSAVAVAKYCALWV